MTNNERNLIELWAEDNLFGDRYVEGIRIDLSPTQKAVLALTVFVIEKWEERTR